MKKIKRNTMNLLNKLKIYIFNTFKNLIEIQKDQCIIIFIGYKKLILKQRDINDFKS